MVTDRKLLLRKGLFFAEYVISFLCLVISFPLSIWFLGPLAFISLILYGIIIIAIITFTVLYVRIKRMNYQKYLMITLAIPITIEVLILISHLTGLVYFQ